MLNDNQILKWVFVTVLVLTVLPLVAMLVMMSAGAVTGAGMMSNMGGMMGGSGGSMGMSGAMMGASLLWMFFVAAALIFLIVLLVRGTTRV
jgi:hypothetical protein